MTPEQKALARHALGLPNDRKCSFRNHFVAEVGTADCDAWREMVALDLASEHKPSPLTGGDPLFTLKRAGADRALGRGEILGDRHFFSIHHD